ncbi:MAG: restriction endonuclease subunit S [Marinospirillum sp.]|uniref:restriction endonuclease subunit S n=1 Tax=Marinospirillum sp. TaxID=2183934 RepID=UPI0019DA4156|nr:restriction endonuclease subunit S [Marinospirillum sp.]MBE0506408.1 restriction endonuclease subunit S [Marinospirillum sp.]
MEKETLWRIPDNWAWSIISDLGDVLSGGTPSSKEPTYWGGNINWISPADLTGCTNKTITKGNKSITEEGLKNSSAKLMPAGSIHFSSRAPIGYVAISAEPLATNQGFKSLVPEEGIFNEFVYFYLKASKQLAENRASGTTFLEISGKAFGLLPIPIPPTNEQKRIASKIEELFSELDNGITALKTAREQLKVYRQSVLKHAFEGKLTAKWREENADKLESPEQLLARIQQEREARYQQQLEEWKAAVKAWEANCKEGKKPGKPIKPKKFDALTFAEISKLGGIPSEWSCIRIGEIALVGTGVTPLKSNTSFYECGDIPWVTSGALNDTFIREPSGYVTVQALNETNLRLYPAHTLVVALYGEGKTRGKCSELLIEATTNQAIAAIMLEGIPSDLRTFIKWFLTKNYEDMRLFASGGVQPNLNLGIIENMVVPLCSIQEAKALASMLDQKFSEIDNLDTELEAQLAKAETLRQSILKKAFSGQLVPQDPNDEPASDLLARIQAEKATQPQAGKRTRKKAAVCSKAGASS